jgi:hypothetical protein
MKFTIFYSWQRNLPSATNRSFIQTALENAAKAIRKDDSIEVDPVIDRDTLGVPGSPDIAETIFQKIENAHVVVCDVTPVNQNAHAKSFPNPNVLIELGYAIKCLGIDRIIMILNKAYGSPENLPFDLRKYRILTYNMPKDHKERSPERKSLEGKLEHAIRLFLEEAVHNPAAFSQNLILETMAVIQEARTDSDVHIRKTFASLVQQLAQLAPDFSLKEERDELLVQALAKTTPVIMEFAKIAQRIAEMDLFKAAWGFYRGRESLLQHYDVPQDFRGSSNRTDFDFYKFVGHEIFVAFFSFLIREHRWAIVENLLYEELFVQHWRSQMEPFSYISAPVQLLVHRNQRLGLQQISLHATLLNDRHAEGELANLVPMQQFMDTDFFLALRPEGWYAPSLVGIEEAPRFIFEAQQRSSAEQLSKSLNLEDILQLRKRFDDLQQSLLQKNRRFFGTSLGQYDSQNIGMR